MGNREYQRNQKIQRKLYDEYRKSMWKMFISFLIAGVAVLVLPQYVFPFLKGFLGIYIAKIITIITELVIILGGVISGVANAFKAVKCEEEISRYQDKGENIVYSLISENEKLNLKINELEKENEKIRVEAIVNNNEKTYEPVKENVDTNAKVKKYVR